jgi:DNA repair protein RecO (recombination protein O)
MSRASSRVSLANGYVLHQRPFRDSSLIIELFARDHGRLTVFAHAARGPRSRFSALQPFQPLLLSWSGRGEAGQLTGAEPARVEPAGVDAGRMPPAHLMSAFYLNELLLKLLTRHDPTPELYDHYESTLRRLKQAGEPDAALRHFEARLLELIGYGLNLEAEADTGQPVRIDGHYRFQPGVHGFVIAEPGARDAIQGEVLRRLAGGLQFDGESELQQARTLMRAALDHCLEGRPLSTRLVARELRAHARKERTG